ncbi:Protein trichome birefringence-like 24 [Glycine max]|nr:Protein trichome birefringence-like 24 [Glycine max]
MRMDYLKQKFPFNHRNLFLKLLLTIFFIGLAFRILFFHSLSPQISPVLESPFPEKVTLPEPQTSTVPEEEHVPEPPPVIEHVSEPPPVLEHVPQTEDQLSPTDSEKCDYFNGDWIPNPSGPVYTNDSCDLIESHQNCLKNGRPDRDFLYWRWAPRECDLPQFDPKRFLNLMRNKAWALIGDSISRNHVQSLVCILSKVEKPALVYHDEEYKCKRWNFPSYNLSLSVIWSPFLVEAAIFEDINGVSSSEVELHLDRLDSKWTDQYLDFDYIIISTGKWFLKSAIYYENETILGCHSCPKRNLTELGFNFAYRKALKFVMNFIVTSNHKGLIFFRTFTPDHFENGEWFSGGTCNRTAPIKEGEMEMKYLNKMLREIELEEFGKAASEASKNGVNFKLVDFASLSQLRPDGHPGPYRQFHPFEKDPNAKVQNDCLHWCLPGPIDSWNDIIMDMWGLGPGYTNESCDLIVSHQNCLKNGRPDREFLYWRWAPRDCDLPQLDPERFLYMMWSKAWALVGDSISLNNVQSLLCILAKVEQLVSFYHGEEYKCKSWRFPSYNFSMSLIWSPFLVEAAIFEDENGVSSSEVELHLDKLDSKWTDQYLDFDYISFSTGKWFLKSAIYYENDTILGCHSCPKKNLTELGFNFAYCNALKLVMNFIVSSNHKGIFFRTFTPDHFENMEWLNGGTCKRTTPIKGEMEMKYLRKMLRDVELDEVGKAATEA